MKSIPLGLLLLLLSVSLPDALAQATDPFRYTLQVTGTGEGAYNIRANVRPTDTQVPLTEPSRPSREVTVRSILGETSSDAPAIDPDTQFLVNQALDLQALEAEKRKQRAQQAAARSQRSSSGSSGSSSSGSSSSSSTPSRQMSSLHSPYHLLTDGSLGSDLLTEQAIDEFYHSLPSDIASAFYDLTHNGSAITVGDDPYVPYARAMHSGDYARMRDLANSPYVANWNDRIAMLGTAGAAALRDLSDPNNQNKTAAKDALQKIAEDLQYAGEGIEPNNQNNTKLKTICAEISRIWSNLTQGSSGANQ